MLTYRRLIQLMDALESTLDDSHTYRARGWVKPPVVSRDDLREFRHILESVPTTMRDLPFPVFEAVESRKTDSIRRPAGRPLLGIMQGFNEVVPEDWEPEHDPYWYSYDWNDAEENGNVWEQDWEYDD